MPATQIYPTINTIAQNLSYTGQTVVDASTFTAFADTVLRGSFEPVYNTINDVIGRTVVAIDEAEDEERGIIVDSFTYGAIMRKLSYTTQASQSNSDWDIANPENPYTKTAKGGIVQKWFNQTIPTFSWDDVQYDKQLREGFHSAQDLAGFLDGLYTRMRNAYKVAKLGLADAAIAALIGYIYSDSTDLNASRRVRHLLTEYNSKYGTTLTADTALVTPEYLEYVRKQIITDQKNLNKLTHLYNTIGASGSEVPIDRRSSGDDLKLDLSLALTTCYDKYWSAAFNEEYVKLPKHSEVVNWGIATDPQAIKVSLDGGTTTISVSNILGLMYDRDAVVATLDEERFINMYDQWNARNLFKLAAERRYIVDPTENAILYLND